MMYYCRGKSKDTPVFYVPKAMENGRSHAWKNRKTSPESFLEYSWSTDEFEKN